MKDELYKKVYIHSVDDLPKEDGSYIVHSKTGEIYQTVFMQMVKEVPIYWKLYDWYLQPIEQPLADQDLPSNEDIEEWIKSDANWAKTFINGAIYGAKTMRDGLIKSNDLAPRTETEKQINFETAIDIYLKGKLPPSEEKKEEVMIISGTNAFCVCAVPDREAGFSYCHKCNRHVSPTRMDFLTNVNND